VDNLTHTLIGVLAGATAAEALPTKDVGLPALQRRTAFVALMAVGSNFPDLDFLYSAISGNRLDYLLQHRGHTHTVIGAIAIAALLLLVCELWMRSHRFVPTRGDRVALTAVALLAPLLHIAMDFTNNYGVHPFWPLYNGWLYGDSVFIVEPSLWVAATPLIFLSRTRTARVLATIVVLSAIVVSVASGFVPLPFTAAITALALALLWIGKRAAPRMALAAGIAVWLAVTCVFTVTSSVARSRVEHMAGEQFPTERLLDAVLTPMPANPICWEALLMQTASNRYVVRRAMISLAPSWLAAAACPSRSLSVKTTAPLTPISNDNTTAVQWHGEFAMSRSELAQLAATNCQAAAFLKFARAPWFAMLKGEWTFGDVRYDREPQLSFAEVALNERTPCPRYIPSWLPPRGDLIGSAAAE
jgi:inner membrane protein